jgi:hypothetical protein
LNLLFFSLIQLALAQPWLQYQNRGNRFEGIKPKPVTGRDVDLISVLANYKEETKVTPKEYKVQFYLKQESKVYVTVRELNYKYYYWLDEVQPENPWRTGFQNVFKWDTETVIQKLDGLDLYELGAVARLGKSVPSQIEQVAPVILYHDKPPSIIKGYLFTFKTASDAKVNCKIFKEGELKNVFAISFPRKRGGRPFTIRWDSLEATEGFYKLMVSGYFLDDNFPLDQTVVFYHQKTVN